MHLNTDTLHRFLFANAPVKGELVQLPHTWRHILNAAQHRAYPRAVRDLLGQMTAACALLSANLKFDGSMIMQIHGDGAVQLLVVECRSDLTIRATAKVREHATIDEHLSLTELINPHGQARFAITLDPNDRQPGQQPYQGIVPLVGDTMAQVLMHYMHTSEQLDTHIQLASSTEHCAGILLQRLPSHGGTHGHNPHFEQDLETWVTLKALVDTVQPLELLRTPDTTLLHQLFWEHPLEQATTQTVQFGCTCTPSKVADMIKMLGEDEARDMIDEESQVHVHCDFCGQLYVLSAQEIYALFDPNTPQTPHLH